MGGEFEKLREISDRTPDEVIRYIYANAEKWRNARVGWIEPQEDGNVVLRVWAFRSYTRKGKTFSKYTEICRKISGDVRMIYRNGYWCGGWSATFIPVYEQKDVVKWRYGYKDECFLEENFNKWRTADVDVLAGFVPIINLGELAATKYRYAAFPDCCDLMLYLREYDRDPMVEYFGKLKLYPFPSLVRLAKRDRGFCRFLAQNAVECDLYGCEATIYAYKHGLDVVEARRQCERKHRIDADVNYYCKAVKETKIDRCKLVDYLDKLKDKNGNRYSAYSSYNDYFKAIRGLGLDLNDTKNIFPRDFWRMHDLRIAEYASIKAKQDRTTRKKLYDDFASKALKLKAFEISSGEYRIVIPGDIEDLIREGDVLNHCVGKMGYDKKVVDGISIVAFLRKADAPETPLYTMEYRIDLGKLAQCYGRNDSRVPDEIRQLAETWAKDVKKRIKTEAKK